MAFIMSKIASLPTVYCCKSKNRTYIRTYKNERVEGKSYPVKTNIKNIAEIANGDGVGRLIFTDEFLKENQHFIDRRVIRIFDESSQKYVFLYANIQEEKAAEFGEHQKVTSVRSVGMYYACRHYLSSDPLIFTLKDCFPKTWDKMFSLAMFCADEGDFRADHYSRYAKEHKLPYQETLTGSQITRLFQKISDTDVLNFFSEYTADLYSSITLSRRRFWALDSTSISTYSKFLDAKYGHSKQGEDLPQINGLMVTDEISRRPLFYEKFNGSIPDVSTVASTFKTLLHLDTRSFVAAMDRCYYKKSNLKEIVKTGFHFLVCVPCRKVITFDDAIKNAQRAFISGDCYNDSIKQNIYTPTQDLEVKEEKGNVKRHKVYVHVFHSPTHAGDAIDNLLKRRSDVVEMLKNKDELDGDNLLFAKDFIKMNKDTNEYGFDNEAFQRANNLAGVFLIVSDAIADGKTAFEAYKSRESVEDCFKDLKVKMNCNRPGVSTEESLTGKCFIEFIALSIRMLMQYRMEKCKANKYTVPHKSFKSILAELNGIKEIEFNSGFISVMPISKAQQECLKMYNAKAPSDRYDNELAFANRLSQAKKPH